jgi:predicted metal-dependent phosphotriesterase family hydrolase
MAITPAELEGYRATAYRRKEEKRARLAQRYTHAWELAHEAARLLKNEYGASRVEV